LSVPKAKRDMADETFTLGDGVVGNGKGAIDLVQRLRPALEVGAG
jgi:hypothetical protein